MKKFVVFDLDGTLIDTLEGITKSVNDTLSVLNKKSDYTKSEIASFIGHGARRLFYLSYQGDFTEDEFSLYLKYYEKDQYVSSLYPHVHEVLKELNKKDIKIIIFSNKPNEILQKLVSNKLSDIKLEFIQGQDKNYPPKPDVTLLRKILNSLNLDPKDGIYVGDSDVDTYTARNIGMPSIILSYGYGDKKLISESKPDYYIDDFSDIIKLIWTKSKN